MSVYKCKDICHCPSVCSTYNSETTHFVRVLLMARMSAAPSLEVFGQQIPKIPVNEAELPSAALTAYSKPLPLSNSPSAALNQCGGTSQFCVWQINSALCLFSTEPTIKGNEDVSPQRYTRCLKCADPAAWRYRQTHVAEGSVKIYI